MEYKFSDIVDMSIVEAFIESQWLTSDIMLTVTDNEQTILARAGWQEICSKFHHQHPSSFIRCDQNDLTLHDYLPQLTTPGSYHEYKCKNGLMSIAMPIFIEEQHLATLFTGQFLYQQPNHELFKQQAATYGWDEEDYLDALNKVPILARDRVEKTLNFMTKFVSLLTRMGTEKLAQLRTQHHLQTSEEKFRTLFEYSSDAVYIVALTGKILEVNQAACELLSHSKEELLGMTIPQLLIPEQTANFEKQIAAIKIHKKLFFEIAFLRSKKEHVHTEVNMRLCDYLGESALLCSVRDISERKQVEDALRESERQHATLLANLPGMVYHCHNDRNWTMEFISEGCFDLTGYPVSDLINNHTLSYNELVHPDDQERLWQLIQASVHNRQPFRLEYRIITAQDNVRWVMELGRGVFSPSGELLSLEGFITDITERKKVEEALRDSEMRYRAVVEDQTDLICRFFPDGRLSFVNEAYCRYFGKEKEELLGNKFMPLIPEEDQSLCQQNLAAMSPESPSAINIHRVIRDDGEIRWLRWTNRLTLDNDGTIFEYQSVGQDITEQKQAERDLAYREKFEALIASISSRFVASAGSTTDRLINLTLKELGEFAGVDRSYVFQFSADHSTIDNTHEWCAPNIESQIHNLQQLVLDDFPWFTAQIATLDTVYVDHVDNLPIEAEAEKTHWQQQHIQSLMVVPICSGDSLSGFLGFDSVYNKMDLEENDLSLLRTAGEILGNAISRQRIETEREKLLHNMGERIKELRCLYRTTQQVRRNVSLAEIFAEVVALIPAGWQYPNTTRARLVFDGQQYCSEPFELSPWLQSANIIVNGEQRGVLEVYYLRRYPLLDEGPFLNEERQLLDTLAHTLSETIERKQTEETLQSTHQRLQDIIEFLPDATFVIDQDKKLVAWNRAIEMMTGIDKESILGQGDYAYAEAFYGTRRPILIDLIETPDSEIEAKYNFVKKKGDNLIAETYVTKLKNGQKGYFMGTAAPLFDHQGQIVGAIESIRDISELKQAEASAKAAQLDAEEARDKIEAILTSIGDGLIVTDLTGRIIMMNRTAEQLTATPLSEAFSLPVENVLPQQLFIDQINEALTNTETRPVEWLTKHSTSSTPRTIQAQSTLIKTSEGTKAGVISILRDVSHERELDQMKNEFISTAAHELRTPLTSVLGFAEILLNAEQYGVTDKTQQHDLIATILDKAQRLETIISELLDLSRIQSGHLITLKKSPCNIGELLTKIAQAYEKGPEQHRFDISLSKQQVILSVDQGKMEQVLDNLISNAVKFSPQGAIITISSRIVGNELEIAIKDKGIGMTPEQVERVFDKFYRADASDTGKEGLGLGMAIVKSIIEGHNGSTRVESELDQGTTVFFSLPLDRVATK